MKRYLSLEDSVFQTEINSIKIEYKRLILSYKKVIQNEIVLTSHWFV